MNMNRLHWNSDFTGIAGGEQVPPAPLGWFCDCFSKVKQKANIFSLKDKINVLKLGNQGACLRCCDQVQGQIDRNPCRYQCLAGRLWLSSFTCHVKRKKTGRFKPSK